MQGSRYCTYVGRQNTKLQELGSVIFYIAAAMLVVASIVLHVLYTLNKVDISPAQHDSYLIGLSIATILAYIVSFYLFTRMLLVAIPLSLLITGLIAGLAYFAADAAAALL